MQNLKNFGFVVAINKKKKLVGIIPKTGFPRKWRRISLSEVKVEVSVTLYIVPHSSERGGKCSSVHCSSLQTAYWDSLPTSLINVNVFNFPLHDMWSSDLPEQQTDTKSLLSGFGWNYIFWLPTRFFMEGQTILWNNHVFLLLWDYSWILQNRCEPLPLMF